VRGRIFSLSVLFLSACASLPANQSVGDRENLVYVLGENGMEGTSFRKIEDASSSELTQDRPKLMRIYWFFGDR
jgi:hypothetical protein